MKHIQYILKGLIILGTIIIVGTVFGEYIFILDLFSHFYLQIFIFGVFLCLASFCLKSKKYTVISGILLIFLGYNIFPAVSHSGNTLSRVDMYYINSNYYIDNGQEVIQDIEKYNPKYVAVVELRPNLAEALTEKYGAENSIIHDDGVLSYGVFTRDEILSHTKHQGNIYPFLEFRVPEGSFYLIHPLPPMSLFGAGFQKENFQEVRDAFDANTQENKYIFGDFNSSHYSRVFQSSFGDLHYQHSIPGSDDILFHSQ